MSEQPNEPLAVRAIRLYTVPESATILGISEEAVRDLIRTNQLRARRVRPNAIPRIPGQSLLDYVGVASSEA